MLRVVTLTSLVAPSAALTLQPAVHARSAAAVRSAAAMMSDPDATRDSSLDSGSDVMSTGETREELMARLRQPIRQFDGGWADTAGRYGGKKDTNVNGEKIENDGVYGTGGGLRLDDDTSGLGSYGDENVPTLPPEKQEKLVLPDESFKITKMAMSSTDEDFEMECNLDEGELEAELFIDIEPMFLTPTPYFYGFTADSDAKISIDYDRSSLIEGTLAAKAHDGKKQVSLLNQIEDESTKLEASEKRTSIKLKFKPAFEKGEFVAYMCVIFPEEKAFSKFYKITAKCI